MAVFVIVGISFEDVFFAKYTSLIAIPIFMILMSVIVTSMFKDTTNYELAKKNKDLYELGIINEEEYIFRKNEIIRRENNHIEKYHATDKEKYKIDI